MRTLKFLAVSLITLSVTATAIAQTADEIVDKHIAAVGGLDKWKAIKTMEMKTHISFNGMEIPITNSRVEGVGFKNEVNVMGTQMVQCVTPTSGWAIRPTMMGGTGEPEDMSADDLKEGQRQLSIGDPILSTKQNGGSFELLGKEKVDGAEVFKLKISPKTGDPFTALVSATSYQLLRLMVKQAGQDAEINFSNFKEVEGVTIPFNMEVPNPQMGGTMTIETDSVKINPTIDAAIFNKPKK